MAWRLAIMSLRAEKVMGLFVLGFLALVFLAGFGLGVMVG